VAGVPAQSPAGFARSEHRQNFKSQLIDDRLGYADIAGVADPYRFKLHNYIVITSGKCCGAESPLPSKVLLPHRRLERDVALAVQARLCKANSGEISPEELSELEDRLQLEHIMVLAKARARQFTSSDR
jgi:hypothetical protein